MATLDGIRDSKHGAENSVEINDLARFAVDEHNKKENKLLELARVVKAREQVVAGTMHYLTLEVIDETGNKFMYEAKVWVKPWLNFKELQVFVDVPHFTSSDLGAHNGGPEGGWMFDNFYSYATPASKFYRRRPEKRRYIYIGGKEVRCSGRFVAVMKAGSGSGRRSKTDDEKVKY